MELQWQRKLVQKIVEFEKWGVKIQCSTEEGKWPLVRVIGRFEKLKVREIGIPLYFKSKPIFIVTNSCYRCIYACPINLANNASYFKCACALGTRFLPTKRRLRRQYWFACFVGLSTSKEKVESSLSVSFLSMHSGILWWFSQLFLKRFDQLLIIFREYFDVKIKRPRKRL